MKNTLKTICVSAVLNTFAFHAFAQSEFKPDTVAADTVLLMIYFEQNSVAPASDLPVAGKAISKNATVTKTKPHSIRKPRSIRRIRLTRHQRRQRNKMNWDRLINPRY